MATKKKTVPARRGATVKDVLGWLDQHADPKVRAGMARYGIPADDACGIAVGDLRKYAKEIGKDHALALRLWETERYEARMLAVFVADPKVLSPAEMEAWCRDFDSWAICDTACFHLFDRSPHAWRKVEAWHKRKGEFVKRAAFALVASLALHDKAAPPAPFLRALELVEACAEDERNFVKKGVNWALRGIGRKRDPALRAAARELAARLAQSENVTARWIGKDALREFAKAK